MTRVLQTVLLTFVLACRTAPKAETHDHELPEIPMEAADHPDQEAPVVSDRETLEAFQRFGVTGWEESIPELESLPLPVHPVRLAEAKRLRDRHRLFIYLLALRAGRTSQLHQTYTNLGVTHPHLLDEAAVHLMLTDEVAWEPPPPGFTMEHVPGTTLMYLTWPAMPVTSAQSMWLQRTLRRLATFQDGAGLVTAVKPCASSQANWNQAIDALLPLEDEDLPFNLTIGMQDPKTYFDRCKPPLRLKLFHRTRGVHNSYIDPDDLLK